MQIFALYSGLLGLVFIYLSFNVVSHRKKHSIGIGDGNNHAMQRAIRVHANFTEYVPIALILLAIYVTNNGSIFVTHISGTLLLTGRVLHAYGLGKTVKISSGRFIGTLLTWMVILGLSALNVYYFIVTQLV